MEKAPQKSSLHWITDIAGHEKAGIGILILCNCLVSASAVIFALVTRNAIDCACNKNEHGFFIYSVLLVILITSQIIMRAVIRGTDERVRAGLENRIKGQIYKTILKRDYSALSSFHSGELLNRMTSDSMIVTDGIASILPAAAGMVVKLAGAFIVLLHLDRLFALLFLAAGLCMMGLTYPFRNVMKKMHKEVQQTDGKLRSFFQETIENLVVIRCFSGEMKAEDEALQRMKVHKSARIRKNRFSNLCNTGFGIIINGGYLTGLIWCCRGIIRGSMTYGGMSAVLQLVGQIQQPFANITGYIPKYYAMLASADRIIELEQVPAESETEYKSIAQIKQIYSSMTSLRLSDVTFSYPDKKHICVLDHADYIIKKGEFVAVTGYSGIGKSTLLKLMLAVYNPQSGSIDIELKTGEVIRSGPAYRRLFAYVPQGNCLMSGNIAQAVSFLCTDKPDMERVRQACKIACADSFINEMPEKYQSVIGERGVGLSEGQIQRLAVARAVYSQSPVLLLDEATSALDEQTEEKMLKNLRELTDMTVIIVTHRMAAQKVCSRLMTVTDKKLYDKNNE